MPSGPYAVINTFSSLFHAAHKSPFWVEDHIRLIHYLLCWSVHLQCSMSALSFGLHPCMLSDIPNCLSWVYRSSPVCILEHSATEIKITRKCGCISGGYGCWELISGCIYITKRNSWKLIFVAKLSLLVAEEKETDWQIILYFYE